MKYLLLIALFFFVLALWRKLASSGSASKAPPPRAAEQMVKCAHCGVNQPVSESILTQGRYYCCPAHRHEAESADD